MTEWCAANVNSRSVEMCLKLVTRSKSLTQNGPLNAACFFSSLVKHFYESLRTWLVWYTGVVDFVLILFMIISACLPFWLLPSNPFLFCSLFTLFIWTSSVSAIKFSFIHSLVRLSDRALCSKEIGITFECVQKPVLCQQLKLVTS